MAYPKGAPKAPGSGRQKGAKNKATLEFKDKWDALAKKYGDPIEALFKMSFDKELDQAHRITALKEVCAYRYPKLKSVEHKGGAGFRFEIVRGDEAVLAK